MSKVQINIINTGNIANNNSVFIKETHIRNYTIGTVLMRVHRDKNGSYVNRLLKVTTEPKFNPGKVKGFPTYNYEIGIEIVNQCTKPIYLKTLPAYKAVHIGWTGVTKGNTILTPNSTKFNKKMYRLYEQVAGIMIGRK